MPERRALGERGGRQRDGVHPHPVGHRGGLRELVLEHVEQRLVVVRVDVGDRLVRLGRVAGRLAVVVDLRAGHRLPVAVDEAVVAQVAGEADLDLVLVEQQPRALLLGRAVDGGAVGIGEQAAGEALDPRVLVERAAAADGVAQPVGERADAGAGHVELRGLDEARVVGDLAEVPALAVDVDRHGRALSQRPPHLEHVRLRVMAHEVEAEAVDLVLARPGHDRLDHELLHHAVLGRGVRAAGGGLDRARRRQPVVVAGDDPVEDRLRVLAGGRRVVVDDVHHHAQAGAVDALDHLAELARAGRAVGPRRVGALGRRVVQRVVAPVEAVGVADRLDARLLRLGVGREGGEVARRLLLLRAVLLDRRDVVRRQQVQRVEPAVGQAAQVAHAVAAVVGEGEVGAAVAGGHRLVGDREVAHVQLVDRRVLGLIELRLAQPVPAVWLVLVEVDEQRAARVEAEPERVRVGDHVGDHLVRHVDGHRVGVRRVAATTAGPRSARRRRARGAWRAGARRGRAGRPWPSAPRPRASACGRARSARAARARRSRRGRRARRGSARR